MNVLKYAAETFLFVPFAAIVINNVFSKKMMEKCFHLLTGAVALSQIFATLFCIYSMDARGMSRFEFFMLEELYENDREFFCLTPVTLIFLLCIGIVAFVSVMVAKKTIDAKKTSYVNLLMTLIIGMNGMVMVNDFFSLYVFLDVVGLSSFVLIAMFRSRKSLEGSIKYIIISELATIFILTGLAFLFMQTGSLDYMDLNSSLLQNSSEPQTMLLSLSLILILSGFFVKAGAVPFHSWLPDAHQSADTSISILLSGIVIKIAGIYGIYVLTDLFSGVKAIQTALAAIGILSIVAGALLALCQSHFKRMIAYSSVSQMGYILLALSTGTTLGVVAAVAHVFSHALFKSTLFVNAAAIHEQAGTLEMDEMGGLEHRMPVTSFSSVIAFLSTAGIPPLTGFWSKLLIILALWTAGNPVLAGVALCASIFTSAYFLRMQKKVFFGKTPEHLASVREVSGSIKIIEIILTAITTLIGILFPLVLIFLQSRGIL